MTPVTNEPTAAEWMVLAAFRAGGPMATRDVIEALAAEEWSDSTVKPLLRRLTEKGALKAKRIGNSFLYSATRAHWTALRRAGGQTALRRGIWICTLTARKSGHVGTSIRKEPEQRPKRRKEIKYAQKSPSFMGILVNYGDKHHKVIQSRPPPPGSLFS